MSQYCDHTTVFVGQDKDFHKLDGILQKYQRSSGLKINKEKYVFLF
jgi:hypothetical protein